MSPAHPIDKSGSRWYARPANPKGPIGQYMHSDVCVMNHPPQNDWVKMDLLAYYANMGIAPPTEPPQRRPPPLPTPVAPAPGGYKTMGRPPQPREGLGRSRSATPSGGDTLLPKVASLQRARSQAAVGALDPDSPEGRSPTKSSRAPASQLRLPGLGVERQGAEQRQRRRSSRSLMSDHEMATIHKRLRSNAKTFRLAMGDKDASEVVELRAHMALRSTSGSRLPLPEMPAIGLKERSNPTSPTTAAGRLRLLREALEPREEREETSYAKSPLMREMSGILKF